jgi:acyl-CoA synthetase (AMP-forming)/AMP-acid ligase II
VFTLVHHHLEVQSRKQPDKTAVFHGSETATYSDIEKRANRIAHLLIENGIKPGDRVLVVIENSIECIAAYYGILKAGGVSVEVHDRSARPEIEYYLHNSGAHFCLLSKMTAPKLQGITCKTVIGPDIDCENPGGKYIPWAVADGLPDTRPKAVVTPDSLAAIVYTSGSTGRPKGVMLTHGNLVANTNSIVSYLGLSPDDRAMSILPFYYVYGKTVLNTHFRSGGSIVINNRFAFPNSVIDEMVKKEVTLFAGVPSTFAILLNRSIFSKTDIPSLRIVTQAGGAMAPALTKRLMEVLKQARLYVMYGATEASARISYLPPERLRDKLGSIGIPIPQVSLTVRNDDGDEMEPFIEGNICANGPNIMQGYWHDAKETAKAIKPWGLVTGDLGYRDDEGFFFLTGRKKQMLKIGGERVSPKEIEDSIIESHLIHEAAVIGMPDELLGEVPVAFIVPIDDKAFCVDDLAAHLRTRLAGHKQPRKFNLLKGLPKKPSGKIDKEALKNEHMH